MLQTNHRYEFSRFISLKNDHTSAQLKFLIFFSENNQNPLKFETSDSSKLTKLRWNYDWKHTLILVKRTKLNNFWYLAQEQIKFH